MVEKWGPADELEVGLVGGDVPPVVDIEDRRQYVGGSLARGVAVDECGGERHDDEDEEERGEQSSGASEIELAEIDAS